MSAFFSAQITPVTLPSPSLSNASLRIKVLIRLQSCQNVAPIARFFLAWGGSSWSERGEM